MLFTNSFISMLLIAGSVLVWLRLRHEPRPAPVPARIRPREE